MLRYENFSNIGIETSLHNGYSIIGFALWDKALGQYTANFYIKDDQVNHFDLMEDHSSIIIKTDAQNIRNDLNKYINENFEAGKFNYYIKRRAIVISSRCKALHICTLNLLLLFAPPLVSKTNRQAMPNRYHLPTDY